MLVGVSVRCLMGCFRAPLPWRKTAPLKRPIKRSMRFRGHWRKFQEKSGELSGIQWVLYGAYYEFSGNSWGISGRGRVFEKIRGLGWFQAISDLKRLLRKTNRKNPLPENPYPPNSGGEDSPPEFRSGRPESL